MQYKNVLKYGNKQVQINTFLPGQNNTCVYPKFTTKSIQSYVCSNTSTDLVAEITVSQ